MCALESECRVGVRPMIHCQRQVSFCSTRILRRNCLPSRRFAASRLAALAAERLADVVVGALAAFPAATANTATATAGQALVTFIEPPGSGAMTRLGRRLGRAYGRGRAQPWGRPNALPRRSLSVSAAQCTRRTSALGRLMRHPSRTRLRFVTGQV